VSAAELVGLGINASIILMAFGLGLRATGGSLRGALKARGLLLRSLVAMFVVMPLFAFGIALNFELNQPVLVALLLIALAPVPPLLPGKQLKAGGDGGFVMGLLLVSALAAVVVVPAGVEVIGRVFGRSLELPLSVTARVVATSVLVPVVAGIATARLARGFAEKIAGPVTSASSILLVLLFVPVLLSSREAMLEQLGNFTLVAILAFVVSGLAVGHFLGGPEPQDRTALALATATRHPGVALAVLHAAAPGQSDAAPVVLLYLLVGMLASIPYLKWRARQHGSAPPA